MSDSYRFPTEEEKKLGQQLVGTKISIFWDGDDVFYPSTVRGYDASKGTFSVVYEEDTTEEVYIEDLKVSKWKIWGGTAREYDEERENKVSIDISNSNMRLNSMECISCIFLFSAVLQTKLRIRFYRFPYFY